MEFSLTEEEFGDLGAAAAKAGLARGAYAAEATLSVARGLACPADSPLREALGEFIRAAGLVRRMGVNLNQAVAKLNATGTSLPATCSRMRRRACAGLSGWTRQQKRSAASSSDRED